MDYTTRSELLFLYDIKDANPNGDPLDENKPRVDEASGLNFVTDVRLKRTIRDYLHDHCGFDGGDKGDIFVWKKESVEGKEGLQDAKARAREFDSDKEKILERCIDIRLFGGTIPTEDKKRKKDKEAAGNTGNADDEKKETGSITLTGPVQFKMGRSLHPVEMRLVQGTGAFASGEGASQKTFRMEYVLPYSLIAFHGVINQVAGACSHLTADDVDYLLAGIWLGTGNLISRSKMGQLPRLLLKVDYADPRYFTGDLDHLVRLEPTAGKKPIEVRQVEDYAIGLDDLVKQLKQGGKVKQVHYVHDPRLQLTLGGNPVGLSQALSGLNPVELSF